MSDRIWNFSAGPATLPLSVLEKAKSEIPNYAGTGMAVMEMSHRSKPYAAIHEAAKSLLYELFEIPNNHKVLFLQGGASLQFSMIPMNLLGKDKVADYIITGSWSKGALKEAKIVGSANVAGSSEEHNFNRIPKTETLSLDPKAEYVHITSNNTIAGTQWASFPDTGSVPLVCDMSSDILSRKVDVSKFGIIYGGAQKNLGPSGVTVVIIRDDMVEKGNADLPTLFKYRTHVEKDSLYNTAPTYSIYLLKLVLEWMKESGGLPHIEKANQEKGDLLYDAIDSSNGYYRGTVELDSRSLMNVTFRLPSEELEDKFISEATSVHLSGLKGHRSVGGIRASIYNAMPLAGVKALTDFMEGFAAKNV